MTTPPLPQVKLGGGLWCEPAMAMECSHVFACAIMPLAWEPEPRQRLRRLVASLRQAGADDAALLACHKQLLAGRWHAVTPRSAPPAQTRAMHALASVQLHTRFARSPPTLACVVWHALTPPVDPYGPPLMAVFKR